MFGRATISLGIGPHSSFDIIQAQLTDVDVIAPHPNNLIRQVAAPCVRAKLTSE